MKKGIMLVCLVFVTVMLAACQYKHYEVGFFSDDRDATYRELDIVTIDNMGKTATPGMQRASNKILDEVCSFLNENYNVGFKYEPIEVFETDVTSQMNADSAIRALYCNNAIVMDKEFFKDTPEISKEYVIAHELIHYLIEYNKGEKIFALYDDQKNACGGYFEEASVDLLAKKFITAKYPSVRNDQISTSYKYIRLYAELLELAIPDYLKYFLERDIDGLEKKVNQLAEEHIKKPATNNNFFEKFLFVFDQTMLLRQYVEEAVSCNLTFLACITPAEKKDQYMSKASAIVDIPKEMIKYCY